MNKPQTIEDMLESLRYSDEFGSLRYCDNREENELNKSSLRTRLIKSYMELEKLKAQKQQVQKENSDIQLIESNIKSLEENMQPIIIGFKDCQIIECLAKIKEGWEKIKTLEEELHIKNQKLKDAQYLFDDKLGIIQTVKEQIWEIQEMQRSVRFWAFFTIGAILWSVFKSII